METLENSEKKYLNQKQYQMKVSETLATVCKILPACFHVNGIPTPQFGVFATHRINQNLTQLKDTTRITTNKASKASFPSSSHRGCKYDFQSDHNKPPQCLFGIFALFRVPNSVACLP